MIGGISTPDYRKRQMSDSSVGDSPDAKKINDKDSPVASITNLELPPDDAPQHVWFKLYFSKLQEMQVLYDGLQASLKFHVAKEKENEALINKLGNDIDEMKIRVSFLESENLKLKLQNQQQQENALKSEIHRRENNLIFDGLQDTYGESDDMLYSKLLQSLNRMEVFSGNASKVAVVKLQGLASYKRDSKRAVLCQFLKNCDVQLIRRYRKQLPQNIYVNEELSLRDFR